MLVDTVEAMAMSVANTPPIMNLNISTVVYVGTDVDDNVYRNDLEIGTTDKRHALLHDVFATSSLLVSI
jgi:hypothetical protein